MARLILFFYFLFYSYNIKSNELTDDELILYNYFDLNNDKNISLDEINKTIELLFILIDKNQDGYISKNEISDLKNMIEKIL